MREALIFFVVIAFFGLVGATAAPSGQNDAAIALRMVALTNAVNHHSDMMVQEYRVDVTVTANRFERYLRFGYAGK